MVSKSAVTPLPPPAVEGYVFEGTWSTLRASCLYLEGYFILAGSPTMLFFFPTGSPNQGPGEKARSSWESLLSDWPLIYVSTTMTHNKNRKQWRYRKSGKMVSKGNWKICVHAVRILHTPSWSRFLHRVSRYNGIKLQEKGGSISCRPQTTLQFFVLLLTPRRFVVFCYDYW